MPSLYPHKSLLIVQNNSCQYLPASQNSAEPKINLQRVPQPSHRTKAHNSLCIPHTSSADPHTGSCGSPLQEKQPRSLLHSAHMLLFQPGAPSPQPLLQVSRIPASCHNQSLCSFSKISHHSHRSQLYVSKPYQNVNSSVTFSLHDLSDLQASPHSLPSFVSMASSYTRHSMEVYCCYGCLSL